ncbi:MAG: bifunctional 5,10-methylenetetrahydrofolate dehydrogenase/5,10-methenyltetrahydrofolate cyclohydrolase [Paraclostridium sp.]
MKTLVIDAKAIKEKEVTRLQQEVKEIESEIGRVPKLIILNASDDLGSQNYIRNKKKIGEEIGIEVEVISYDKSVTQRELERVIFDLNQNADIDGLILQLPVYDHLDANRLIEYISPEYDADCFSIERLGQMTQGKGNILPCTPAGVIKLLDEHMVEIQGKNITVIGKSTNVGKALADLLIQRGATVTVCHSKTQGLAIHTMNADIVISCVGKQLIKSYMLKPGSVLIGVGIVIKDGKQHTDYDVDDIVDSGICSMVSNRVNSVGTMTTVELMNNTIKLCKENHEMRRILDVNLC